MLPSAKILTFHGLGPPPEHVPSAEKPFWVCTTVFAATIARLSSVEAETGIEMQVTFDDGNSSDYEHAYPILAAAGRTAQVFVITDRIGAPGYLDESQLRDLSKAGFAIGSHGKRHVDLRRISDAELADELAGSRKRLQCVLSAPIDTMSVPFGLFDARVVRAARKAGYRRIYSSSGGLATAHAGLIPRTSIRADFNPETDLLAMVSLRSRLRSAIGDRLRRARYGSLASF